MLPFLPPVFGASEPSDNGEQNGDQLNKNVIELSLLPSWPVHNVLC